MRELTLLTTAYFPPAPYFSLIAQSRRVLIEREENYHKQTYRNRCIILGANGPLPLVIPVLRGSFHKTAIRELQIDNSRRWRDLHIKGIISAYAAAPYFEYYVDPIREVIMKPFRYLIDLNSEATEMICRTIGVTTAIGFTERYETEGAGENDYRYSITAKSVARVPGYRERPYRQVFAEKHGFVPGLSIIDILLNNGPGTLPLLRGSLE